ncbi:MAG: phospholipase [Planctomycetota bacterium]
MNRLNLAASWNSANAESDRDHGSASKTSNVVGSGFNGFDNLWETSSLQAQTFFVPVHYEPNYAYPLIVWLHSDGFNEHQVCQVMPHISTRNYLATGLRAVKAADSVGHRFCWGTGVSAMETAEFNVLEAVRRAREQFSVHPDRIILAGYREGGTMANQIALRHPDRFAGVINLGGRFELPSAALASIETLKALRPRMLWQHSLEAPYYDPVAMAEQIKLATEIKARVDVRQYRNDDEMNTAVLSDLDRWVMDHVVNATTQSSVLWDSSPTAFSDN